MTDLELLQLDFADLAIQKRRLIGELAVRDEQLRIAMKGLEDIAGESSHGIYNGLVNVRRLAQQALLEVKRVADDEQS